MATLSDIYSYLDEKGVFHKTNVKGGLHINLYGLSRKMLNEVVLPGLRHMLEGTKGEVHVVRERYGKTTEERVVLSIRGVEDDRQNDEYQISWDPTAFSSGGVLKVGTSASRDIKLPRGKRGSF